MFKLVFLLIIGLVLEYSEANTLATRQFVGLCSSGSCKNGASCIQIGSNLAVCLCTSGFSGIYCEVPLTTTRLTTITTTPLVLCEPGICKQNGQCNQITENLAICLCVNGTSGLYCENGSPITTTTPPPIPPGVTTFTFCTEDIKNRVCQPSENCIVVGNIVDCV